MMESVKPSDWILAFAKFPETYGLKGNEVGRQEFFTGQYSKPVHYCKLDQVKIAVMFYRLR